MIARTTIDYISYPCVTTIKEMSEKTELQRRILITAYNNPRMNQSEIANRCDCSRSYVSQVLREYNDHDAMEARIKEMNRQLGISADSLELDPGIGRLDDGITSDFEDGNLEDVGPIGVLVVGIVLGGYFLTNNPLPSSSSYLRWGFVAIGVIAVVAVLGKFYQVSQDEGIGAAFGWLIGPAESNDDSSARKTDTSEKTPPAPENLKNELYFERANRKCEWCTDSVDSPDVHHIKPRNEGGPNKPDNLIVLCPNCHRKADRGAISRSKLKYRVDEQMENSKISS